MLKTNCDRCKALLGGISNRIGRRKKAEQVCLKCYDKHIGKRDGRGIIK